MLTIVTGTPGAGKTLFTLWKVHQERNATEDDKARPLFFWNVDSPNLEYFDAKVLEDAHAWPDCPDGSFIVFDEAQRAFPQRSAGREVPNAVQLVDVHRHQGKDLFIVTQDATNIDVFLRRMCGRHFHLSNVLGREMATLYEYDHYESNPTGYHEKKQAISTKVWKYPKKLYQAYKSASQHVVKKRTPARFYILGAVAVLVAVLIWSTFNRIMSRPDEVFGEPEPQPATYQVNGSPSAARKSMLSPGNFVAMFKPEIPGVLHTAPAFQEVTEVQMAPKPYCLIMGEKPITRCKCYTQQLTVYDTPESVCRHWVKNGFFDYMKEEVYERGRDQARAQPARSRQN